MCGIALTKINPSIHFQNKVKSKISEKKKKTISAISGSPLPGMDTTLWPLSGDATSKSAAVAAGCLTWQEWMINGREEARAWVDEVMLSS